SPPDQLDRPHWELLRVDLQQGGKRERDHDVVCAAVGQEVAEEGPTRVTDPDGQHGARLTAGRAARGEVGELHDAASSRYSASSGSNWTAGSGIYEKTPSARSIPAASTCWPTSRSSEPLATMRVPSALQATYLP